MDGLTGRRFFYAIFLWAQIRKMEGCGCGAGRSRFAGPLAARQRTSGTAGDNSVQNKDRNVAL